MLNHLVKYNTRIFVLCQVGILKKPADCNGIEIELIAERICNTHHET